MAIIQTLSLCHRWKICLRNGHTFVSIYNNIDQLGERCSNIGPYSKFSKKESSIHQAINLNSQLINLQLTIKTFIQLN